VGRKVIMAVTGMGLAGFILVHLLGNTSIYFGAHAFNSYASHLHQFDPLLKVFEVALGLLFVVHVSFGVSLFIRNRRARPVRYAVSASSGGSTLGSSTMFYTGLIILGFIGYHLWAVSFAPKSFMTSIADVIRLHLQSTPVAVAYLLAVLALAVHLSHGLWSLWQSLGAAHPAYDVPLRRTAFGLAVITGCVFMSFPFLAMVWDGFLR
jgi:succinate dehydrogenase / fumarate reductase cytochrome b subunit